MLNALSSTEKNESGDQSRNAPPTIPSVRAFAWICLTRFRISSTDALGNTRASSRTKKLCSSAWCARPRIASARKSSGTNERSAKYAIIAARCVQRSAKNFARTTRIRASMLRRMEAAQAIADLTEISSKVEQVAVVGPDGAVLASTFGDDGRAK